jgi:hypothetical protein
MTSQGANVKEGQFAGISVLEEFGAIADEAHHAAAREDSL